MRRLVWGVLCMWLWTLPSFAQEETRSSSKGLTGPMPITGTSIDSDHNALDVYPRGSGASGEPEVSLSTTIAGEDVAIDVLKVEERYVNIPTGGTTAMIAADQLYKSGPGYVKGITCYSDATATVGTIALLDSTVAGSGNKLWEFDVLAVAYNTPFTVDLQTPFSVGLYLDFTTTADVKCMVRFR